MRQTNWASMIAMQAGVVPMIYGTPGVGKTAVFSALAKASKRRFLQCILRQMMPEDIGGVPVPSSVKVDGVEYKCVVKLLDEAMIRAHVEPSIVLLDEFNHAGHDVMGAAQEWINSPPDNCWMAACANPVEQSTSGVELAPPVVNRMCVLNWERPIEERRAGWRNGFRNYPLANVPVLSADYLDDHGPMWGQLMCDFEDRFGDLFGEEAFPKDINDACNPWPSDRSWTNVGILMAACDSVGAEQHVRKALVAGCVGKHAATQFNTWVKERALPDPEELLKRPESLQLPMRFDLSRSIVCSVCGRVSADNTVERWESALDVVEVAYRQNPEVALLMEGKLRTIKPEGYRPRHRDGEIAEIRKLRTELAQSG